LLLLLLLLLLRLLLLPRNLIPETFKKLGVTSNMLAHLARHSTMCGCTKSARFVSCDI
jgi:hypothetical protein